MLAFIVRVSYTTGIPTIKTFSTREERNEYLNNIVLNSRGTSITIDLMEVYE